MSAAEMTFGNLRDLGGLVGLDGRRVRPATLLRSEALGTLDPDSVARLAAVPVRLVVDLSSSGELEPPPPIWPAGAEPELLRLELLPRADVEGDELLLPLMTDRTGRRTREYMHWFYGSIVDLLAAGPLAELARRLAGGQTPAVVHCAAGQDRTGVLVALLLLALGVPREAVLADYMVTLRHFGPDRLLGWFHERYPPDAIDLDALRPFLVAEEYLEMSIERVLDGWGSIEAYWAAAGVDAAGLARLRAALLEG